MQTAYTHSLIDRLHAGELALPEYLMHIEKRYKKLEPQIHAFVPEKDRSKRLFADAEKLMERFPNAAGRLQLFGTLVGIKDIFHVEGFDTQAGSRLPAKVLKGREAKSLSRLKETGALVLGKTVTTEFAYFLPGPTRNPHNIEHTPGGSSSGSAAAVAAGFCQVAIGTQTIGSIIRPASFCGVVGIKPTYDRIAWEGAIHLAPSLDHVGFFTPDVETAILMAPILFKDWKEPTLPLRKPRLGVPEGPYLMRATGEGLAHFEMICNVLMKAGYELQRIPVMSDFAGIHARHHVILAAEAAKVHAEWFDQYGDLYSKKLSDLIRRGKRTSDDQLQDALGAQEQFRADMRRIFLDHNINLWICPSALGAAPRGLESTGDPVMNLPWTQTGLPTINLPAGKNQDDLPLGLQVIGNWYKDESLLFWAKDLEKVLSGL
jgi:Asp-tRNA(Asn)/Glu-tRNA(Gln) amidotransferase A subunit family amidase